MAERRIVAVGDLHGDMESALSVLRMAGVIHQNNSWAGGNHTILVQTGDLIDRGPDTVQLLNLFPRLVQEANKAGGRVIQILGNHEFMNMLGDLSFVRERSSEFASRQSRKIAFSPSGDIGRRLFNLPIMHQIGDTVFTHGGILPAWASSIVHRVNAYATQHLMAYFAGALEELPAVFGPDGPTWYRGYALGAEKTICSVLQSALNAMGAKRMVVGHTMQDNGRILSRCDKRFFVIDVGISKAMLGYQAALEILPNGSVRGIYPSGVQELSESVDTDIDDKRPTAANSGERKRKSGE
ncbi:Metallo-dependent phosphatase-like protein [Thamnocephalis sphaerospora]|uniref:Metallo-dependent phosphatase-like protein n=1 Tax=Thamnocephalis sphaerospora TaxID=78915 RepID=A0A4P9XS61_9FUNG|nr:Metallo-dependent phosphatase-like protein [Thamnocephalis sphaerospora]|eukprot:RKP08964.1 Metallo-dependent phosphatase-like protein [Thamnocephalis sphaerospora]